MNILHTFPQKSLKKKSKADGSIILTNKEGNFFLAQPSPATRYAGFFWHDLKAKRMIKIVEGMSIGGGDTNPIETVNTFYGGKWKWKSQEASFFLPTNSDSLVCETKSKSSLELTFDVKGAYDNREWGRQYGKKGIVSLSNSQKKQMEGRINLTIRKNTPSTHRFLVTRTAKSKKSGLKGITL
jgi:hypothetical protein